MTDGALYYPAAKYQAEGAADDCVITFDITNIANTGPEARKVHIWQSRSQTVTEDERCIPDVD